MDNRLVCKCESTLKVRLCGQVTARMSSEAVNANCCPLAFFTYCAFKHSNSTAPFDCTESCKNGS